ncbi:hypothetical protein BV20DRAFT_818616 [Pilatotrama ljubarskyi]|nr:hypothetical protein BV20DRAFT_818616 [Pilatotrama ljubarskyi]
MALRATGPTLAGTPPPPRTRHSSTDSSHRSARPRRRRSSGSASTPPISTPRSSVRRSLAQETQPWAKTTSLCGRVSRSSPCSRCVRGERPGGVATWTRVLRTWRRRCRACATCSCCSTGMGGGSSCREPIEARVDAASTFVSGCWCWSWTPAAD